MVNKVITKNLILDAMDMNTDGSCDILYNSGGMIMHVPDAEILVAIVVRECAKIAPPEIGRKILDHFGVKQ